MESARVAEKVDLEALKAQGLPRLKAEDVISVSPQDDDGREPTPEEAEEIERLMGAARRYFRRFVPPTSKEEYRNIITGNVICVGCGHALDGFTGTFEYGITHGEGRCSQCGYPCRSHHYIKDEDGKELISLAPYILQYHPDELESTDQ